MLAGERSPRRTAVVLNAAAALVVSEITADLREAAQMATTAIDSGGLSVCNWSQTVQSGSPRASSSVSPAAQSTGAPPNRPPVAKGPVNGASP
ncbi:MAG TPA: hypothetical protein PKW90_24525 [Myxococcota bacterium]|nr:hypothetical protein [Myxococcota bacterium]